MWLGQGPFLLWDIASSENRLVDVLRPFSLRGHTALLVSRPLSGDVKASGKPSTHGPAHGK
jgi:hypothetical protein